MHHLRNIAQKTSITQTRKITIFNPANGKLVDQINDDDKDSIYKKFLQAKEGKNILKNIPLKERMNIIQRFKEKMVHQAEDLGKVLTTEMGKPLRFSVSEIRATKGRLDFFLSNIEKALEPQVVKKDGDMEEVITREPLGVIANISAWNYPWFVGTNVFVPALLTGNAVLYKPSEYATMTGMKMAELLYDSGLPKEAFIPIIGGGVVGNELLQLPIDGVFFTGSVNTGRSIFTASANKFIPKIQLELGGKDPVYVHNDVNVKEVAESTADGAFFNNGQSCCSVERIYVHEDIYDSFVEHFVETVKGFKMGDPLDESTYIGPLTRPQQASVLIDQIEDAIHNGGKVLLGGKSHENNTDRTAYFYPTVIVNTNSSMKLMRDESFGPIIGIQKVKSVEEAIPLMNDSSYGLTSAVYSKDKNVANEVLEKMESGTVYWNCCDRVSPNLPWSGRKLSGLGLTLSQEGITTFTQPKAWHKRIPK